jgi:hypothetical protein
MPARHGTRVLFFSELTRMFTTAGTSWAQLGITWENALQELWDGRFQALFLTISERAHVFIRNPATQLVIAGPDGVQDAIGTERDLVRQAVSSKLVADWPPYMRGIIDAERRRLAG